MGKQVQKQYIAIDLKSFYASVECTARGLDPMKVNLVVADASRTSKTICLAVSPSLKAFGIPGRPRLFEVEQKVAAINKERRLSSPNHLLNGKSYYAEELQKHPDRAVDYLIAPPRMALYMETSTRIFDIYRQYVSPNDIHVYSVDEVFMDVTDYLSVYKMNTHDLAMTIIRDVLKQTGITATAGIGTNLYLAKIAMDIVAKHLPADKDGVRIAELDEERYRRELWTHRPLTDFWRVGRGIADRCESMGLYTMGDIARCSLGKPNEYNNEDRLYRTFGVNAELLIDHAWGWENCTIADIQSYRPETNSLSVGQVLSHPYTFEKGRLIAREMADGLIYDLVEKGLVTNRMELTVGYDIENLSDGDDVGQIVTDRYGRSVPKEAHGRVNLPSYTSSSRLIVEKVVELYERIVNPKFSVRRMYVVACDILPEREAASRPAPQEQLDMFTDYAALEEKEKKEEIENAEEKQLQKAVIALRKRFGKNALLKGMNLEEGATAIERNGRIGGHKA